MTKKWLWMLALVAMPLVFVSCSDDDDDDNGLTANHFSYDGTTYDLAGGILFTGEGTGDAYVISMFLHSPGIQFSDEDKDFTGEGHGVSLTLLSPEEHQPGTGTYNFDGSFSFELYTFTDGEVVIDFNAETEEGTQLPITGGSVEVEESGENNRVTFTLETTDGSTITGQFSGSMSVYDFADLEPTL